MFGGDKKLGTESYKGVRDFYPEEQAVQNYIFSVWKKVVESWGYAEYDASILEPLELYKSKTNEEIVNEQLYSFKDKGDREVVLRPEMTPTVARMVAGKFNEIPMPARWYSIPNLFRYEKPQRGRLREHWQLNVDMFGSDSPYADAEVIMLANDIMKKFGAKLDDYEIRINSRALMDALYKKLEIPEEKSKIISRIIDKKDKISAETFKEVLEKEVGETAEKLIVILESKDGVFELMSDSIEAKYLADIISILEKHGIQNLKFTPTLTRGFDYYTGIVFELFGTNSENSRSIFGGGRYDNLINDLFGKNVSAVGFGWGDVTTRDFLKTHNLLPKLSPITQVWIVVPPETNMDEVYKIAAELREKEVKVGVDISGRKLGDQIISAEKRGIPHVLVVGTEELKSKKYKFKNLATREETSIGLNDVIKCVK
ncbi:MAG: histidine--tRNA ligase [Patescibacteria group bacterium]